MYFSDFLSVTEVDLMQWKNMEEWNNGRISQILSEEKKNYLFVEKMIMKELLPLKLPLSYPVFCVEVSQAQILKHQLIC